MLPGGDGVCALCAAIVDVVSAKRQSGVLPPPPSAPSPADGAPVATRSGEAQTCWVCDTPIVGEQERHAQRRADCPILYLHPVCHVVWQKLRLV